MLSELSGEKSVVGCKQTLRAIKLGCAVKIFVASDVDPVISSSVVKAAAEAKLPVEKVSMRELGKACSIDVPAVAAALILHK